MLEFILKNWRFTESSPPIIYGNVFGNPRFIDGIYIHTSSVQQVTMDPDRKLFLISTKSGSIYLLPFDSMSIPYNEINKKQIENLSQEQIDSVWSDIITFSKESLEKQKEAMEQRIENFKEKSEKGSLYLEFIGNELEKAIFHRYDTDKDVPNFTKLRNMFM